MGKADEAMIISKKDLMCAGCFSGIQRCFGWTRSWRTGCSRIWWWNGAYGRNLRSRYGAFMVIGLKYGMTVLDGSQSHRDAFAKVREFAEKFRAQHGSIVCRDLTWFGC